MREELVLNVEKIANSPEDYDALRETVNKLATASENQFEEIKKEKWYNRVFDMITFSKKNEKRLAEQISTLAQAQQILVELLLRLAQNDENISQLVLENTDSIRRLSENDIYLLERIKKLEERAQGIHDDTDFRTLSEKAKKVLCALLYKLSERKSSNEVQAAFANAILSYLGENDVQMDNPFAALADFEEDTKTRKAMLACCMEYIYLGTCTDDAYDKYQDFIDEFDFGRKTVESIKAQISKICAFRGAEGLYKKYVTEEEEEIDDSFYIEVEDVSEKNIINDCKWYPVFERKKVEESGLRIKKYLTEIYLVMKEDSDIRKTITTNAVSGKAYGDYIYYMIDDKTDNRGLHIYSISKRTESVIKLPAGYYNVVKDPIINCTDKWVICLRDNHDSCRLNIFNIQTNAFNSIKLNMTRDDARGVAIVGDCFFYTQTKDLYKCDMNTMKITKELSITSSDRGEWSRKLHTDGKYLHGFWSDGNYQHYVEYDTRTRLVVETCKIAYDNLSFDYDSVYCNDKMYYLGRNRGVGYDKEKVELRCFDMKSHEIALLAEYDTLVGTHYFKTWEIQGSLQVENGKVRCEVIFDSIYSFDQGKHIKEYF